MSKTRNIRGLEDAGSLFKYDGEMPDTSHYKLIDEDIKWDRIAAQKRLLTKTVHPKDFKNLTFMKDVVKVEKEKLDKG